MARPLSGIALPDPTDLPFLEVAATGVADSLVTGNTSHYIPTHGSPPVSVVSSRQYIDLLDRALDLPGAMGA